MPESNSMEEKNLAGLSLYVRDYVYDHFEHELREAQILT